MENKNTSNQRAPNGADNGDLSAALATSARHLQQAEDTIRYQQQQLHRLEVRSDELFNSLDEAFCIIEVLFDAGRQPIDYRFLKINSVFEQQTGIVDALGRTMREIAPAHEAHWFEIYGAIALSGIPRRFEHRAEALDRFFDVYAFRVGEPKDAQVGILFKNIAERKQREELQAYLLQLSDTLRTVADPLEIQRAVSQLAQHHLGADRAYYCEIDGDTIHIQHDEFRQGLSSVAGSYSVGGFPLLQAIINDGKAFVVADVQASANIDAEFKTLCLHHQVFSFIGVPITKKDQPSALFFVACRTPRQWKGHEIELVRETAQLTWAAVEEAKATEALRNSEENYRAIVNQSIAGILKMDLQGHVIFSNDQFCRMLGYECEELLQLDTDDLVYAEDRERHHAEFVRMVTTGNPYEIEKRMVRKDGAIVWVNNHVSPIYDKNGVLEAAAVVSIDVSRQKELERLKDEFIGIASHELKTPITGIKAYGEIIAGLMDESVTPTVKQLVGKMNLQVGRLVKLIYSLLNTSQLGGGQLALHLEVVDLNALLEEHVLQGQLTTARHRIIFNAQQLPHVFGDVERLGQVVDNLLSNAIKYDPMGGDIIVTAQERGGFVRVSVQDFGMGIPKGAEEKIFERFYRVKDASASSASGIGLGLYICRAIIEKHQGRIGVDSQVDEGSTFYFELPIHIDKGSNDDHILR